MTTPRNTRGGDDAVVAYWFTPDQDNPGCDCGYADAILRLPGGELLCAEEAAARGITRPQPHFPAPTGGIRLWFHLDEVRPLIAHATGCQRHRITGAQAAAQAPFVPALVWRGTRDVDELVPNGWPSWHDAAGHEVTATCHTWMREWDRLRGVPAAADRRGFIPLAGSIVPVGDTAVWDVHAPRWTVRAADPSMHWIAVDIAGEHAGPQRPHVTVHESRGDLYPPDATWQPATVACVPTIGPGRYPALIAGAHANTNGGELARFTRATVEAMIADLQWLDVSDRSMPGEHAALKWRDDDLCVYEVIDTFAQIVHRRVDVIRPDHDGLYPLGAHTWPWLMIAPDPSDLPPETGTEPDAGHEVA